MTRPPARRRLRGALALFLAAATVQAACGKKGPPLAPLRPEPAAVPALAVKRLGSDVYLRFTVPTADADGRSPSSVRAVEVYVLPAPARDAQGRTLEGRAFAQKGALVARVEVKPPADESPAGEGAAPDARPAQGESATVVDAIPAEVLAAASRAAADALGLGAAGTGPARVYGVVGRTARGRFGALRQVEVPLGSTVPAPAAPSVAYDESALTITWTPPAGARRPLQEPAEGDVLPSRPVVSGPPAHTYNVYALPAGGRAEEGVLPVPVNERPLDALSLGDPRLEFGVERCYVVRTVEVGERVTVESAASPATCVTPRDTFPPAAPRSLAAVGAEGVINLIWEPGTERDLAGYVVLRGEADGGPLAAITPAPIRETTYRDTAVRPGTRYVYAVVAVDSATPQNVSAESNRVEETAR